MKHLFFLGLHLCPDRTAPPVRLLSLLCRAVLLLLLLYGGSVPVYAQIINVPADYTEIQEAIEVAMPGDTILVQPGTYYENLSVTGRDYTIGSLFLTTGDTSYIRQTVLNGNQTGCVLFFTEEDTSNVAVKGFTITNGRGGDTSAGGITITKDNKPLIEHCIIRANTGTECSAIYVVGNSKPVIRYCIIENNKGLELYNGDIVSLGSSITLVFENNIIRNNLGRVGIDIKGCDILLRNCIYVNNRGCIAAWYGSYNLFYSVVCANNTAGFVFCTNSGNTALVNCTLYNNGKEDLHVSAEFGFPTQITSLLNTIIWSDTVDWTIKGSDSDLYIKNCLIKGGYNDTITTMDYSLTYHWLSGNISEHPGFIDPQNNDFRLAPNSPCIGAGTTDTTGLHLPPYNGELWEGIDGPVDIGALEHDPYAAIWDSHLRVRNHVFDVFPNPASDKVTLSMHEPVTENAIIQLVSLQGKIVLSKPVESHAREYRLTLGQLPAGVYFVRLRGETFRATKQIIIEE